MSFKPLFRTALLMGITFAMGSTLLGCASFSQRQQNAAIGAGVGAIGGSVLTGGSAIGTLGGAAIGGLIGHGQESKKR